MHCNHSISDLVSRIKNGYLARKDLVFSPYSKIREGLVKILEEEGYISSYKILDSSGFKEIELNLKYTLSGESVISEIEVVSKPGKRVHSNVKKIPVVRSGLGLSIISTSAGLLADYQARERSLGGELLLMVF